MVWYLSVRLLVYLVFFLALLHYTIFSSINAVWLISMLRRGHWSAPVSALLAGTLVSNLLTSRRIDLMHFPGWILCKATKPGVSFSVYFFLCPSKFQFTDTHLLRMFNCFINVLSDWLGRCLSKNKKSVFLYHKTMSIFMLHWRNFGHHFQCDWWPIQLSRYQFFYIYIIYDAFLYHGGILFYEWNTITLLWFFGNCTL